MYQNSVLYNDGTRIEYTEELIQNSRSLQTRKRTLVLTKHISIRYILHSRSLTAAAAVIIQVFVRKNRLSFRDGKDKDF